MAIHAVVYGGVCEQRAGGVVSVEAGDAPLVGPVAIAGAVYGRQVLNIWFMGVKIIGGRVGGL